MRGSSNFFSGGDRRNIIFLPLWVGGGGGDTPDSTYNGTIYIHV